MSDLLPLLLMATDPDTQAQGYELACMVDRPGFLPLWLECTRYRIRKTIHQDGYQAFHSCRESFASIGLKFNYCTAGDVQPTLIEAWLDCARAAQRKPWVGMVPHTYWLMIKRYPTEQKARQGMTDHAPNARQVVEWGAPSPALMTVLHDAWLASLDEEAA